MTTASRLLPGALALALLLTGCVNIPSTYQPPIERRPTTGPGSGALGSMISMNDPGAQAYIVRDVSATVESGAWRWAFKRPELRFALARVKDVKLAVDLTVAKETFDATGPVTISFFVNDRLLEAVRYDQPGDKHFEKLVPAGWLRPDAMTTVSAEIDKLYKSPLDGAELGFILSRAGFIQ
ncbi:MAG TPA: hypothetical protein VLH09_08105 [Bryobacteraceae bacterium]|nr:hypothetical protein [Bryobacteraceae bacterium]